VEVEVGEELVDVVVPVEPAVVVVAAVVEVTPVLVAVPIQRIFSNVA
jgi:hypothetical protein